MKLINLMAALATSVVAGRAGAVPVKFPDCANTVRVAEVPGSLGYVLNEDCSVLYVLPPLKSKMTVNGYRPNANLGLQCDRLRKIDEDSNQLEDLIRNATRRMVKLADEIETIEENLRDGLVPVGQSPASMQARMKTLMEDMDLQRSNVDKWQASNNARKLTVANAEGGRGKFVIESSLAALIKAYQEANPKLRVVAMPIDQGFLSVNETKIDASDAAAMPAVRSLKTVGLEKIPLLLDPKLLLQFKELAPTPAPDGSKLFNGAMGGEIQLSNVGACSLSNINGGAPSFTAAEVKDYIAATSTYSYQVQVKRRHKLTYNFKELVRLIHEQSKRGGFFNTTTINSLTDERRSSTWINFEVASEDQRYEYSDAYVREVKKEFLDRALAQIITLKTGSPAALMALIEPGKNGAGTVGDELAKCPHLYCQIGAAGFRVLDSIFGSSTAVSQLLKTVDGEMVDVQTEAKMIPVYGTGTFE